MRFDWYQGTIQDDVQSVLLHLSGDQFKVRQDIDGLARSYLYERGFTITNLKTNEEIMVLSDGKNGKHGTHFIASSQVAQAVSDQVRATWGDGHHVTRADACQDLHGQGLFRSVVKASRKVARKYRLSAEFIQDPCNPLAGATQYLGARKSDYRGRAYQKGLEIRSKLINTLHEDNPKLDGAQFFKHLQYEMPDGSRVDPSDVVRVEAQIRPRTKGGKQILSKAHPSECFGFSHWLQEWAKHVLAFDAVKLDVRGEKKSDFDHKCEWMVKQYHPVITEILDCYGADGAGGFFEHLLKLHGIRPKE
jgi:predicted heme/steroid binding protein